MASQQATDLANKIKALSPGDKLRLAAGILDNVKSGNLGSAGASPEAHLTNARMIIEMVSAELTLVELAFKVGSR